MFSIKAECFSRSLCELAEGPFWNEKEQSLHWVDIKRNCVLAQGLGDVRSRVAFDAGQNVGCAALRTRGGMILGTTGGIYLLGPNGEYERLEAPGLNPRVRFNDGKCDALGRFWAGTINLFPGENGIAALYCVLPDLRAKRVLDGATNSNGLAFSRDMHTLYYIDTPTRRVDAFDIEEGADGFPRLVNRRAVIRFDDGLGWPDGMTIDQNGQLWIALWGSGDACCYDPAGGERLGCVRTPVRAVSSCCFGGRDMSRLFITTAREGMFPEEEELAGNVYCAELDVTGAPSHRFGG